MDDTLLGIVLDRLDRADLPDSVADLVVAACESTERLEGLLGDSSGAPAQRPSSPRGAAKRGNAYLKSIRVRGFRGIGPEVELPLALGPGLTLVAGRNGSAKSSIAEGLELLLTGGVERWKRLPAPWRAGWRNEHIDPPTEVTAELCLEDSGVARVRRAWSRKAKLDEGAATIEVDGQTTTDTAALGWTEALATYRPFLAHAELEAVLGRPSELYEMVASVLGLGDLAATIERLASARKGRQAANRKVDEALAPLLEALARADNPRAETCHRALSGQWS